MAVKEARHASEANDILADTLQTIISKHGEQLLPRASTPLHEIAGMYESATNRSVITSLSFPEINQRYIAIPDAHKKTFQWLFDVKYQAKDGMLHFGNWLKYPASRDERLFWISGKPGAGKSTLVRFLEDNKMTYDLVDSWANKKSLLFASCFFWNAGAVLQKSQEGLLQTLLYRLLSQTSIPIQDIVPVHWHLQHLAPHREYR